MTPAAAAAEESLRKANTVIRNQMLLGNIWSKVQWIQDKSSQANNCDLWKIYLNLFPFNFVLKLLKRAFWNGGVFLKKPILASFYIPCSKNFKII